MSNPDQTNNDSKARMLPVCTRCGSEAIIRDAAAVWSVTAQWWEIAGTFDSTSCQDCGASSADLADWRPLEIEMSSAPAAAPILSTMIFDPGTGTLLDPGHAVLLCLADGDADDPEQAAAAVHASGGSVPLAMLLRRAGVRLPSRARRSA